MPFWRFSASSLWLILLSPNPRLLHILEVFSLSITGGVQDGRNVPLALAGGRGYFWDVFRRTSGEDTGLGQPGTGAGLVRASRGRCSSFLPCLSHGDAHHEPPFPPGRKASPSPINMPGGMAGLGRGHQQHPAGRSWGGKALLHMPLAERSQEMLLFQKKVLFLQWDVGQKPPPVCPTVVVVSGRSQAAGERSTSRGEVGTTTHPPLTTKRSEAPNSV